MGRPALIRAHSEYRRGLLLLRARRGGPDTRAPLPCRPAWRVRVTVWADRGLVVHIRLRLLRRCPISPCPAARSFDPRSERIYGTAWAGQTCHEANRSLSGTSSLNEQTPACGQGKTRVSSVLGAQRDTL